MPLTRVSPPAAMPVTLDDLKRTVMVDFDDDDELLTGLLEAAVARLDGVNGILGRCLMAQVWDQTFPNWSPVMKLAFPNVSDIAVSYVDGDGNTQQLDASSFEVIDPVSQPEIVFKPDFAAPDLTDSSLMPITVRFTAGFGGAEDCPAPLEQAILFMAASLYDPGLFSQAGERAEMLYKPYVRSFS
jgi:uncharacterized phiE125 gp8 family phage protein